MSRPDENIDNFLKAAKRAVAGGLTAEEQTKEKKRAAAHAATQSAYNQFLRPIVDALCALPEKNGRKFSCTTEHDDSGSKSVLKILLLYQAANDSQPEYSRTTNKLSIHLDGDEENISPYFFVYDDASKTKSSTTIPADSAAEAPAALGKWVAQVIPDRLGELEKSLRNGEPRKIKAFKPLQLQNPKK